MIGTVPDRPVALVGMPGAGKTSAGRLLATRTGWPFFDTDEIVVRDTGRSIAEIFFADGPTFFRAQERAVIERLAATAPAVIATGGGAMVEPQTRALLLARTLTVWLDVSPEMLARRLAEAPPRPLLSGPGLAGKLAAMAAERQPYYAQASIRIDAAGPPDAVAAEILASLAA